MAKKKPMGLKQQTEELRMAMLRAFDEYSDASKEMAAYEGKIIDEVGLDNVNAAILKVQSKFAELWHVVNFIQIYHQFSTNSRRTSRSRRQAQERLVEDGTRQ